MKASTSRIKVITAIYDFAADSTAGAVGIRSLATRFHNYIQPLFFRTCTKTPPASAGGGATLAFGYRLTNNTGGVANAFMPATPELGFGGSNQLVSGIDFYNNPVQINTGGDFTMTVAGEALTGGVIWATLVYIEFDIQS